MGHEPDDVPSLVRDPRNVVDRAVRIVAVAGDDSLFGAKLGQCLWFAGVIPFEVIDGQPQHCSRSSQPGDAGSTALYTDAHGRAEEPQVTVLLESAGEHARLGENLKAVAHPQYQPTVGGERPH